MITIQTFVFNYFRENTYVLCDETREAVIIDCGCRRQPEEKVLNDYITENRLSVKHLLCTHLHLDHIFGNPFVLDTYNVSPRAHILDVEQLPKASEQALSFGLHGEFRNIPVLEPLAGGDVVSFGSSTLKVLHVPGHSPGSLAFYNKEDGFVVVGDALFAGSIGRTDLWGGSHEQLVASIHNKILSLPNETVIYPGHGPQTSVACEKQNNPYL